MAKMKINITYPSIDLIKGFNELANECKTIFTFSIHSTPNADIKVFLTRLNDSAEDYSFAQINIGGAGWQHYTSGTLVNLGTFIDRSTGETLGYAQFRIVVGNAYLLNLKLSERDELGNEYVSVSTGDACNLTKVEVADITNQQSEEKIISRCNSDPYCGFLPKPTAADDEYTVNDGETKLLDVALNDDSGSNLATKRVVLDAPPSEGTATVVDNKVEYIHTGATNTIDTFTYHIINDVGVSSNIATVTINIPYVDDGSSIPYYPVTIHWAGGNGKGDRYTTNPTAAFTESYGVMLKRTESDGTVRETDIPNNTKITNFLEDDVIHSTIPANQIRALAIRYHNVDRFAVDINTSMPNLDKIRMRGNWSSLGDWDLSNLTKLNYFDISMCFINTLQLPPTDENDTDNYFTYAYLGHYERSDNAYQVQRPRPAEYENEAAPRQVVNTLMRRAFYSNVSDATPAAIETKHFNSQTSTGTLYYDGVNYHKLLIDKGWDIKHISTEETVDFGSSSVGTATLDFMTSHHNWDLVIPTGVDWLTADKSEGLYSNDVQTITFTATENTTGAQRSTEIYLRKIKEYPRTTGNAHEDGTEFHYRAVIIVTQP